MTAALTPSLLLPASAASSAPSAFPDPIHGIFPFGSICTLAGASGVGKTALYAGWIRRWFAGQSICKAPVSCPPQIGILVGDRRWQSHRQWLDVAGVADDPRLRHYSLRDDDTFPWNDLRLWPKVKDLFSRALDKLNLVPGSALIVDPLPIWLPGRVNDYKDVAVGLGVLDTVIRPRDLSLLGVFHQSKQIADKSQQYKRPQDKILGSAAQIGFSDTAFYLEGPDALDTPYYGFGWVPHNTTSDTLFLQRDAWGLFEPYQEAPAAPADEPVLEAVPADAAVGVKFSLIESALEKAGYSFSKRTIYSALGRLAESGRLHQPRRGVYARALVS